MASTVLSLLNGKLLRDYYARGLWRDETIYAIAAAPRRNIARAAGAA